MELGAPQRSSLSRGGEVTPVVAGRAGGLGGLGGKGVHEVDPCVLFDPTQEVRLHPWAPLELVPLHLWMLDPLGQGPDHAGKDTQAGGARILLRPLVEQLEAHADTQERQSSADGVLGYGVEPGGPKGGGTWTEGTDSREHHACSRGRDVRIVHQLGVSAQMLEGLLGRAEVADPVVEDGDHRVALITRSPWWLSLIHI